MVDVFKAFPKSIQPLSFLELNQGGILGNTVKQRWEFGGILKERKGMSQNRNMELKESTSTLHIRPTEPFIAAVAGDMVGHGIIATKNGATETYRIVGYPEGYNFDAGVNEFYRVLVKAESLADYGVDS